MTSKYRPISLFSKISPIPESLLFNYIYLIISPVIKRQQFGFMKRRDAEPNLSLILINCTAALMPALPAC